MKTLNRTKKQKYQETTIYKAVSNMHMNYVGYFRSFDNSIKNSIGISIDRLIVSLMDNMRSSYFEDDKEAKRRHSEIAVELFDKIEWRFSMLKHEYKCLSDKQYAILCSHCASIESNLNRWNEKLHS